jgi:replication-associated recombination protein RarA
VLTLKPLLPEHIKTVLLRSVSDKDHGLSLTTGGTDMSVTDEAADFLSVNCDGDARVALNALEVAASLAAKSTTKLSDGNCFVTDDYLLDLLKLGIFNNCK